MKTKNSEVIRKQKYIRALGQKITKYYKPEYILIILVLSATILSLIWIDLNSINSDEEMYLLSGRAILEGSEYPFEFTHRLPLLPALISLFYYLGFSTHAIRLIIPILFIDTAIISTYFFAKVLYGSKEAVISLVIIVSLPFIYEWGLHLLRDIPFITFCLLFLIFFYLGIEKDRKYLLLSALFLCMLLMLKTTAILLIPPVLLFLLYRKKELIFTKEFGISIFIVIVVCTSITSLFVFSHSAHVDPLGEATAIVARGMNFLGLAELLTAPVLLFCFFGITKKPNSILLVLVILTFLGSLFLVGTLLHPRHLSPVLPLLCILAASGFLTLNEKFRKRRVATIILTMVFISLLVSSLLCANFLVSRSQSMEWGVEVLSEHIKPLDGNLAIDYEACYYNASLGKDVVYIPAKINLTQSKHDFLYFTDQWIDDNNISHVVLSIYYEYRRSPPPVNSYFHPRVGHIEISFLKIPYGWPQPPPDYNFQSELYNRLENSYKYEKIDEIYRGEQRIFIIYKVKPSQP